MHGTLLFVVAHAVALAARLDHARGLVPSESGCCVEVTELQSHVAELQAENLALRKVNERQASDIDECRAENVKQPLVWRLAADHDHGPELSSPLRRPNKEPPAPPLAQAPTHRRRTLATPAPTPLTPIPTPVTPVPTTATPSATPSASPVPTTAAITTYAQLDNAVADTANSEIIVAAPFAFPSQAPITIGADRTVSIAGSSAVGGGRVTLDGAGRSRLFWAKDGGSLSLSFLDLVNATAPGDLTSDCIGDYGDCWGATILVTSGGTLTVRSCLIRGGGPGESDAHGAAYVGAGVAVAEPGSNAEFYDVDFQHLRGKYGGAFAAFYCSEDLPCQISFRSCRFEKNVGLGAAAALIGWTYISAYFYDTTFARNDGIALFYYTGGGAIERCKFIENTGSQNSFPALGGAGLVLGAGSPVDLRDCLFERNVGADGYPGGAASVSNSPSTWRNVSFISNSGHNAAILSANNLASVTLIGCSARSNHGSTNGAGLWVENAELHVFNSTFAETTGDSYEAFRFVDAIISFHNSTIRDSFASAQPILVAESRGSFTDCRLLNNRALLTGGLMSVSRYSTVSILRTIVEDNSAGTSGGCFQIVSAASLTIEDSDIVNCRSGTFGGMAEVNDAGTSLTILNSRVSGSSAATKGSVAYVHAGAVLRIAGSIITDSADGSFAIYDASGIDFSVQVLVLTMSPRQGCCARCARAPSLSF